MRRLTDRARLERFMDALGRAAGGEARVYLTGGASAVLLDWRSTTIDVDLEIRPERDDVLRAIPVLKEELELNVELVSPAHFIPPLPDWEERSPFIRRAGDLSFHHYDFYAQALSKIERAHARDTQDVREMHARKLIELDTLIRLFQSIEPELFRYPAIDPRTFRTAVDKTVVDLRRVPR